MMNETLLRLLRCRWLLHLLFWGLFSFFFSLGFWFSGQGFYFIMMNFVGVMLTYIFYIYFSLYIIYDFLVLKKYYIIAFIGYLAVLYLATQTNAFIFNNTNPQHIPPISFFNFVPFFIFLFAMTLAIKIARTLYLSLVRELELKNDLLAQKDYFLRSQIHPHFLFNTLSNFYGLALIQSKELPDFMLKLAHILRHQLAHSEQKNISLQAEINYLKDYIDLEKIRFSDNLYFNFNFPDNLPVGISILPSVLIVFFENAFKFSKNTADKSIRIEGFMNIEKDNGHLHFYLQNTCAPVDTAIHKQSGIGLKNIKKRLDLNYGADYQLIIKEESDLFKVDLRIKI